MNYIKKNRNELFVRILSCCFFWVCSFVGFRSAFFLVYCFTSSDLSYCSWFMLLISCVSLLLVSLRFMFPSSPVHLSLSLSVSHSLSSVLSSHLHFVSYFVPFHWSRNQINLPVFNRLSVSHSSLLPLVIYSVISTVLLLVAALLFCKFLLYYHFHQITHSLVR